MKREGAAVNIEEFQVRQGNLRETCLCTEAKTNNGRKMTCKY